MVTPGTVVVLVETMMIFNEVVADQFGVVAEVVAESGGPVEYSGTLSRVLPIPATEALRYRQKLVTDLLRDIFGNLFRPVAADPRWLTSTAVGLARTIYDDRAFDRLPILADALEETGCGEPAVLDHCRSDGPHVKGCWVIDLLLGKE